MPYVDVKVTIWERYFYNEGTDIKTIIPKDYNYSGFCADDHPSFSHSDILYDTIEELSYCENGNQPTVEIYDDSGNQVWTNEPIEEKRDNRIEEIIERKNEY